MLTLIRIGNKIKSSCGSMSGVVLHLKSIDSETGADSLQGESLYHVNDSVPIDG